MGKDNESPINIFRKECIRIGVLDNNGEENYKDVFCLFESINEDNSLETKIKKLKSDLAKEHFELFTRKRFLELIENSFEGFQPNNDFELKITKSIQDLFSQYKSNLLNIELKTEDQREKVFKEVKLSQDVPEFIGEDMRSYGPYKKGEIVSIPLRNAEILIREKVAES
ncbi:MAG: hypothetical protein GYA60_04560 [Candidatus Methanofastidiosa archaeon]|nr:hypothetical protein [Candidatus Methanofastidiosa archaeon]